MSLIYFILFGILFLVLFFSLAIFVPRLFSWFGRVILGRNTRFSRWYFKRQYERAIRYR